MKEKKTKKVETDETNVNPDIVEKTLEQAEIEIAEFKDKWLRTLAEFENYRKNSFKEKQDWLKYANEKIILDICEVLDNFERALSTKVTAKTIEPFTKGVNMIFQQLEGILKKNDVIKLDASGKEFDPNFHEALAHTPSDLPENKIVAVIQNGYMIGEKVIRPSRVAVSNGEKPETEID
ncbi:MAG: nucleotide exchange factor GrpE [Candidatus Cloacimonetes bacterium]|nr:nucleotide exchange factor GrpE [Candidatus Cloacimonadota bacterium]